MDPILISQLANILATCSATLQHLSLSFFKLAEVLLPIPQSCLTLLVSVLKWRLRYLKQDTPVLSKQHIALDLLKHWMAMVMPEEWMCLHSQLSVHASS